MAIYTPRQAPSRSQRGAKKSTWTDRLQGTLPRKQTKPVPFRPQALVGGSQRAGKWKRWVKNIVLFLVLLGVAVGMLWLSARLLMRSNVFRLSDIRITGEQVVTERQVLDLSGLQHGGSLLRFNVKAAEARIATHPWVERAEIKTQWPSAVEISVIEHQPFALANLESGKEKRLRYVSRSGFLFADAGQGQELDLPVITGVVAQKDVASDVFVKGGLAEAAYNLLQLAAKGNAILPIQAISEVHIDQKLGLVLYLVDRPFPVYFGADRLQTKYYRLVRVLEQLYAKKQVDAVKEIRMDYLDDKVLVTGTQIDG
ncbi:Polypeptide-transport-associated domain protein FtsQ-type [Desulfobulbus propionicus DSM 2032]|jgi:cell division septal protein FtsQ|uniref:Polypeptide-transport-associated domain protein FtsQ-type n=1 Tax=Desulfobulbus propionicus (strain ATCC 33891 / DSM 2032 / VKM B-1956 / 1pr3) TaxID=577650 RepID=A0A7U4DNF7_DESPD|nr:FtsQ-type POTRA domain-containing protein [Desulfobulbus propionicus]ADW16872.1 Polypeptide-transport-associated domain protein FtsQ-type [Desulfobulbus propionicus DSM 2032]